MVTLALADCPFAALALMVAVLGEGKAAGDVYMPVTVTVPIVLLPPWMPFTLQFTTVALAVNCFPEFRGTVADPGVTVNGGGGGVLDPPPPQPIRVNGKANAQRAFTMSMISDSNLRKNSYLETNGPAHKDSTPALV
jgi:hypothetical protein